MSTHSAEPDHSESRDTSGDPRASDPAADVTASSENDPASHPRGADDEPGSRPGPVTARFPPEATSALPDSLTFRITPVALLVVLTIAVCASPAAAAIPWLSVLYLVPLSLLIWIVRVRTTVHGYGLTVRTVTGTRELNWDEIRSLRLDERRWVRAVTRDGTQTRLPAVRVRDLPRLAAMSGGRLSNPDETAREEQTDNGTSSDE